MLSDPTHKFSVRVFTPLISFTTRESHKCVQKKIQIMKTCHDAVIGKIISNRLFDYWTF